MRGKQLATNSSDKVSKIGDKLRQVRRFVAEDVWDIELSSLSSLRLLGIKALRVFVLIIKGFREDECPLHASALTFSTLMSIVPILALSLALARGLGDAETAKNKIRSAIYNWTRSFGSQQVVTGISDGSAVSGERGPQRAALTAAGEDGLEMSGLATQINTMVESAFEKVDNISFKALGGVGLVMLVLMVIAVLGRVEASFNRVWGVTVGRSIWRRFADYLSVVLILPFLVIAASSLPIVDFATRFLDESTAGRISSLLGSGALSNLAVAVMTSLCFSFIIMFMPNTRVRILPGLTGGIVVGLLFIVWMRLCAAMQIGVARYGKIYGSFAVVPIVLAWVYVSWEIVLFGAEVAFAVQNCTTYRMERGARRANVQSRIILALSLIVEAARAMVGKAREFEIADYARRKCVPVRFLNDMVTELVQAGFLAELSEKSGRFVLLKSPESLKAREVIDVVMLSGVKPDALGLGSVDPWIEKVINMADHGINESLRQITIQDLLAG